MNQPHKPLLLLEDDDLLRETWQHKLGSLGWQVRAFAQVSEALAAVTEHPWQAAVLDQNVGNDNGLHLIRPILTHAPQCRVLVLTGYGSIPAAVQATRQGAWNYLTKPVSLKALLAALEAPKEAEQPVQLPDEPASLERLEWEHIQRVLSSHNGNISAAARTLGMHRRTLQRKLKKKPTVRAFDKDRHYP